MRERIVEIGKVADNPDYATIYVLVDKFALDQHTLVTHEQVINYLEEHGYVGWCCGHIHDCCGCVSRSSFVVVCYDSITEQWICRATLTRNV